MCGNISVLHIYIYIYMHMQNVDQEFTKYPSVPNTVLSNDEKY